MKAKKAFTLVELLVVIGIICILVAVMIPVLTGVMNKTNEQADEVSAGLYTSVMQQFANEKVGEALLYPNLTTTGADAEYTTLYNKAGRGMFPGYNILEYDNDDDIYDAIRREAVIAIKAFSDVKTLDGYYVSPPVKEHYQYVYYYLTGQVVIEDERTMTPISSDKIDNGIINVEDYWVYLSCDGGSGDSVVNEENGKGNVFIQIKQFGTDVLLKDVKITLRIGSSLMTATTGGGGTVGFSGIELGSVFVEAEKEGTIAFPDSKFYSESGEITVKSGGYVGDSAANPYVINLKIGSLGSLGFYQQTKKWNGSSWSTSNSYITDNIDITSVFSVDTSKPTEAAQDQTYYTNAASTLGKQLLMTSDGRFLLYGPYNLRITADGFRDYTEKVIARVYGIDNYKNGGAGDYSLATSAYEYPIIMRRVSGKGVVSGTVTWERSQQPLAGTSSASGTWVTGDYNYAVRTRIVMKNKSTSAMYYSDYFIAQSSGQYPFIVEGLPDGEYTISLETPYGDTGKMNLSGFPETVTVDGAEIIINTSVVYADIGSGNVGFTLTYDARGSYDPISDAKITLVRHGSVSYGEKTTNGNGSCSFGTVKRGFYQVQIRLPDYIGSLTYTYKLFVDGSENVVIRLPINAITVTGIVTGYQSDGTQMDVEGSFEGLVIDFVRYSGNTKGNTVSAIVDTQGVTASYTVSLVPGSYKIVTRSDCYKSYSGSSTGRSFASDGTFNFSLTIDAENISCHPQAEIVWRQNSSYHWQECSKCKTVFNKKAHTPSSWIASGTTGCYRYCTEPGCKRTIDSVTAHDYRYTSKGSYAATCIANGNDHFECYRCGYEKNVATEMIGHNFGDWSADDDSTHSRSCRNSGCSATESKSHDYEGWYWISREIKMSEEGNYCYSNGIQRADCLTCGHYKLNYPKVSHAIDCFLMRDYQESSLYYNFPVEYDDQDVFFVTASGRVYHLLAPSTSYSGRRIYRPSDPDGGRYGYVTVFTELDADKYTKSSVFNYTNYSHIVSCANKPVIDGVTYYCYAPICHNGNPYRTVDRCGCANKPLGYIMTASGVELFPALNPNWENPYTKQGREYE